MGDKMALGYMWLKSLAHFQGKLYSVQIDEREFPGIASLGVKNYLSLQDIPDEIDYLSVPGMTPECRERLNRVRPVTFGQAARVSGVKPADIAVLYIYVEKLSRSQRREPVRGRG